MNVDVVSLLFPFCSFCTYPFSVFLKYPSSEPKTSFDPSCLCLLVCDLATRYISKQANSGLHVVRACLGFVDCACQSNPQRIADLQMPASKTVVAESDLKEVLSSCHARRQLKVDLACNDDVLCGLSIYLLDLLLRRM